MPSPPRVLIVDDSPTIVKVVSAILARHGFEPHGARDGLVGLEMIKAGPRFDLVLLDCVMPRMNGYQFCRELRSDAEHRAVPVVLMSAKGDKIRGQFVQQTGAVDAITKPFDARALVAVLQGALSKTAEGRARPVPEGEAMPEEDSIAESIRPTALPRQQRMKSSIEVAQHIAHAVVPSILALAPWERENEAALMGAVARSLTGEVVETLATTLRDLEPEGSVKELMSGDIAAIPLAEILQVLQMQRQTGVLRIASSRATVAISMRQGLIDFVHSRGVGEEYRLGRYFVEKGLLTRDQVDEIVVHSRRNGAAGGAPLLGDQLLDSGKVSRADLDEALMRQSSELIYDVLRWPAGRFSFTREAFRPEAQAAKLGLGVAGLVLEGFRRVDEWRLMEGTINFDQVVVVDPMALDGVGMDKLTRTDKLVLGAVNGMRTVNEVIRESSVNSFDAIRALYQFLQSRVLRPRAA